LKVLITGASGFVGSHVLRYLKSKKGFEPFGLDITGADVACDVTNSNEIFRKFDEIRPEGVIHLAAMADIKKTTQDVYSCYKVNCFGTLNVLEASVQSGVSRFLFASSANVYGAPIERPVKETTPLNPRLPYDYSKVIGENLVMSYHRHKKLNTAITRSWLLFGEGEPPARAIPTFIRACLSGEPIQLFNQGRDITDPTYVDNYARVVELCLNNPRAIGEVFNVGSGTKMSIKEIAEEIKRMTKSSSELRLLPPRTEFEREPQESYCSIEKIKSVLGYHPIVTFEEGMRRTIEWVRRT
jgi:nucleoside-diphosphate-sugar epimerase